MKRVTKDKKEFFYTDNKNGVGTVTKVNATKKCARISNNTLPIPNKEDQISSKEVISL